MYLGYKGKILKFAHWTRVHPCYSPEAHFKHARIHLPVAAKCNIQCNYCKREINKYEWRPGVASCVLSPDKALEWLRKTVEARPELTVVGIAGPGEPLANRETFLVLEKVRQQFPQLVKCVATNGLLLAEKADLLARLGVKTVTVTINAVNPQTASKIYEYIVYDGRKLEGVRAAEVLLRKQFEGVRTAVEEGLTVRVNMVLIPEINLGEAVKVAEKASRLGASLMNIIPLIPMHRFKGLRPPSCQELRETREKCERYLPQFRLCKMCRADACGVPGLEKSVPHVQYRL
ncbi:MAG: radical SAM protein [Candidatus Hecatellaceae archaeon]